MGFVLLSGACSRRAADPLAEVWNLDGVPLSEELRPSYEAARRALAQPEPTGREIDELTAYLNLASRIDDPASRLAAGEELFARWRRDPGSYLWIHLAMNKRRYLHADFDYEAMAALPELADTSRGPGAFLTGLLKYRRGQHAEYYLAARHGVGAPTSLDSAILDLMIATIDFDRGDALTCVRFLLDALPRVRAAGGCRMEARYWRSIAVVLASDDRLDDALHAIAVSVAMWNKTGCAPQALDARGRLADILNSRHEKSGARLVVDAAVADARAGGYTWILSKLLTDASAMRSEAGDREGALKLDRECLNLSLAMNDSLNTPRGMANVADDLRYLDRLTECRALLDSARTWAEAYGDPRNLRKLPQYEIPYYLRIGDYGRARQLMAAASDEVSEGALAIDEAEHHLEMIKFALELGDADLAYRSLGRLQELQAVLYDKLPDSNRLAEFEMARAGLLARQGEYRAVAAALDRADTAIARNGGENMAWELDRNRGELALVRGDLETARRHFVRCLESAGGEPARTADSRLLLAVTDLESGDAENARKLLAPVADGEFGARFRTHLATLLYRAVADARAGLTAEALVRFNDLLNTCTPHTPPDLLARLHLERGRALVAADRPRDAEAAYLSAWSNLSAVGTGPVSPELRLPNRRIRSELVELAVGLCLDHPEVTGDDDVPLLTLAVAAAVQRHDPPPGALSSLRRPAGVSTQDAPWIIYRVGQDRSFRWFVRDGEVALAVLPGRAELAPRVARVLADIHRPQRPVDAIALASLGELLPSDLNSFWTGRRTLRISADGVLAAVPWALLPVPVDDLSGNPVSLLDLGPICEQPVLAGAAAHAGKPQHIGGRLLVYGNDFPLTDPLAGQSPPSLTYAEAEARDIASLWSPGQVDLRLGSGGGTLAAEDLEGFDVVHLAAHTQANGSATGDATLRLATPDGSTPITARRLAGLRLHAGLVYLSCCEAAVSGHESGGLQDLAGACLAAGADAVIASGQLIDDRSAGELAHRFYRAYLDGDSPAEALRRAQLDLRDADASWAHPYYWSTYRLLVAGGR